MQRNALNSAQNMMKQNTIFKFSAAFSVIFALSFLMLRGITGSLTALALAVILTLLLLIACLSYIIMREKKIRKRLEGQLTAIETSAKRISNIHGKDTTFTAVSMEEKDKSFFDSAYELTGSISGTLEMLKGTLSCHNCMLFDAGKKRLTLIAAASSDKDICYEFSDKGAESLCHWIAEHRVPLRIGHIRDRKGLSYYTGDEGINSFLGVPVFGEGDSLKAVLCVDSQEKDAFGVEAERLLVFAAHGIAESLENFSSLRRMKIEASEFAAFYRLSKRLSVTLKLDKILDIAISSGKEIVDYDVAAFILKQDMETLKIAAAKGIKAAELINKTFKSDDSIMGWVIKNNKPLLFSDFPDDKRDAPIFPGVPLPIRSLICLPLCVRDDTIGMLLIAGKKENSFSQYETKIFEVIAAHTTTQIYNARMYQQMEKMATTDGLTGLFNHRSFQEKISHELDRAERYKQRVSLLLIDIDHFKKVNDAYGHPAGDKILKGVAKILVSSIRGVDMAARYGGEEFALILVNTDGVGALDTAERIRRVIENNKFDIGSSAIKITGSVGIAVFPDDTGLPDQGGNQRLLISKADGSLYLAKKEGRNRVYRFRDVADRIEKNKELQ